MTAAKKYLPHYTVEDYSRWEGDWELWDGIAISMAPDPFGRHQELLFDLAVMLREALIEANCNAKAVTDLDWIVSHNTVVRPDVSVVCGRIPERHLETTPALVVEVLSESTRDRDRTFKRDLYESQGVAVYMLADPETRATEVLVRNLAGKYEAAIANDDGTVSLTFCGECRITLDLQSL